MGRLSTALVLTVVALAGACSSAEDVGAQVSPSSTSEAPGPGTTSQPARGSPVGPSSPPSATSSQRSSASTSTPRSTASASRPVPAPSVITGRVVSVLPTSRKVVALTFDGGSGSQGVDSILATLAREHVAATFFLTGDFTDDHPNSSARVAAAGSVGNHTYFHPHLPLLSDTSVRSQLTKARTAIVDATGEDPRPLFRFPYGDYDSRTLKIVNGLGYVAVGWTVDTLGWKGTSEGITVSKVVSRVVAARTPGEIVLMHLGASPDGSTLDADALPRVISGLRAYGYGFVTLDQLRG